MSIILGKRIKYSFGIYYLTNLKFYDIIILINKEKIYKKERGEK